MSYQVFARKYRPQKFDEVVGQEHITRTLKNAIEQNRLAHAYLFVGPRGTGKTSTARILAKALNCEKGPTITPCGVCDNCREIAQGISLDVLEIDGASNNGVDNVRDLRETVRYAPARGRFKIYIIDEVHMLSTAAFNALLKTLEEPPEHVKFVFATTEPQKVLPTILSRCQRFDLRRIPAALIAKHLQFISKSEGIALDDAAAHAIAKGAEGGLRDAESMLDQLVAFCGDTVSQQDVLNIFGFTAEQTVSDLCGCILAGDNAGALAAVHEQAEKGKDLSRLMADLITHLRNLIVAKAGIESLREETGAELLAALEAQAASITMDRLLELIEQFAQAESRMKSAPNKKLHFEIAVLKAVQTLGQATLTEVIDTLAMLRAGGGGDAAAATPAAPLAFAPKRAVTPASAVTAPGVPAKPAAREPQRDAAPPRAISQSAPLPAPEVSAASDTAAAADTAPRQDAAAAPPARRAAPDTFWLDLIAIVRERRPLISSYLETGSLLELADAQVTIGFPLDQKLAMEALQRGSNRAFIESLFAELTGSKAALKCELRAGLDVAPVEIPEAKPEPSPDPADAFKNDPLIRKALEIFKAEVQPT